MRGALPARGAGRRALNHPGIVAVYEYGEDEEHALHRDGVRRGQQPARIPARGTRFDERDAVSIMAQLLDALQFAHEQQRLAPRHQAGQHHRDEQRPHQAHRLRHRAHRRRPNSRETNVIMGTPGYIAPEHYLGSADRPPRRHLLGRRAVLQLLGGLRAVQRPARGDHARRLLSRPEAASTPRSAAPLAALRRGGRARACRRPRPNASPARRRSAPRSSANTRTRSRTRCPRRRSSRRCARPIGIETLTPATAGHTARRTSATEHAAADRLERAGAGRRRDRVGALRRPGGAGARAPCREDAQGHRVARWRAARRAEPP